MLLEFSMRPLPFIVRSARNTNVRRRSIHKCRPARFMILMPAIFPLISRKAVTRWKKKEGEPFSAGDVLLQIESDLTSLDVCAEFPGVLGKILTPDGSTDVPVEQVIALVAKDQEDFANNQFIQLTSTPSTKPPSSNVTSTSASNVSEPSFRFRTHLRSR
ncbi:hypothetical protein E1B28_002430 [Marasmius oreades]|uniref:Lipoyl-binding domain-containing protein n=1 Tax=Marasmius oreades TaxID=181124 RepID=A0A9P7ULR0_9AGAR|nr:uncharacterized protein E1B28_002430 [Marasmius oreades]KAG7086480.1 hypothetical protein E1B28_002430 [Marasmius oreades]